jgi:UDP-glucose 4-epimerase
VNIGTGRETSIVELCRLMSAATGYAGSVTHIDPRPGDVRHSALDPTAAERALGWRASVELADGMRRTLDWYRGAGRGR